MPVTPIFFRFPSVGNVLCAFTSKNSGNLGCGNLPQAGENEHDRRAIFDAIAARGAVSAAEVAQVHGNELLFEPDGMPISHTFSPVMLHPADGLATSRKKHALLVRTADCQAILFAHRSGRFIMGLHVGWRGNRCDFIGRAAGMFCDKYGVSARDVFAVRGPSLGPCCAEFVNYSDEWGEEFLPWYDTRNHRMNLWELSMHQLRMAGLPADNIFSIDICTSCNSDTYYSYRRDRRAGRQMGIIWLES